MELEVDLSLQLKPDKDKITEFLVESLAKRPSNILLTEPYPSDLTLAQFADVVKLQKTADYGNTLPKGWHLLATGSSPKNKMYFGAAFVHPGEQQVVVAHHETTGAKKSNSAKLINSATTFMNYIREGIHKVNTEQGGSYNLAITGHAIGGWIAQITAFTVKYLSIDSEFFKMETSSGLHTATVVFNSPGARDLLGTLLDVYYDRYTMNVFDGLNITVYVSTQNEINTCGLHLGTVYSVSNGLNTDTHSMQHFINAFQSSTLKICKIADWAKNKAEYSSNKKNAKKDSKDDQKNFLSTKSLRQAELKSQENDKIVTSYFKTFAEDELEMLYKLHIIQEQKNIELKILDEFLSNIQLGSISEIFPYFEIDPYNQIIKCKSREALDQLSKCLRQLMRWLKTQFTEAVSKQIAEFSRAPDLIYQAEGQNYLGSSPKATLDFIDSVCLREFLTSGTHQVLCIVTPDCAFEMIRLKNIFFQIKNGINLPDQINKYTSEGHYTFLNWPRLQKLYKFFDSPVDQNDLMMVDGNSSLTISEEDGKPLVNYYFIKSSPKLKKLVFISSQPMTIFDSYKNVTTFKWDGKINFMNLLCESQSIIFKKKNLIFAGNKGYSFQQFMGENSSICDINELLSSDNLKSIATNKDHVINVRGGIRTLTGQRAYPTLSDLEMPLFKTHIKTSKEFILSCIESPNTNILVVMSGMSREELETRVGWEQVAGKDIILAQTDCDAELAFCETCNQNQDKSIYLLAVSGEDVYCKQIFCPGFYLPRKFSHRVCIDLREFSKTKFADDLVVCSEDDKASLLGLMDNYEETKKFTKIVIAAAKEKEIKIIQKHFDKNIHFVKIDKRHRSKILLEWRYSHGSAENLRPCVSMDSYEPIDEETLSITERKIVILTDEPGTGKTTSLASLSRRLESEWVIYIRLKHFQLHIEQLSEKLDAKNVASFLLSGYTHADDSLVQGLLEYLLKSKTGSKQVILMFAGFDEMDDYTKDKESAKEKIVRLLIFLKNIPTVQIFLTARKYLKEFLESKLGQISTSFERINKQEQLDLLVMFWHSCLSLEQRDYGEWQLKAYAGELLQNATRVLGPDIDRFMGVPLHLKMLAEDFGPQNVQSEVLNEQIGLVTAPNLYKKLTNLKYEIYFHDKTLLSKGMKDLYKQKNIDALTKVNHKLGFKSFFPEFYEQYIEPIEDKLLMKLNRYGLLQSKENGDIQFIYGTYAEYCCAQMVVNWLKQPKFETGVLVEKILLPKILLLPDYKLIRWFINVELNEPLNQAALEVISAPISKLCLEDSTLLKNQKNETALHIAIHEKNEHIVTLLLTGSNIESRQEGLVYFITQCDDNNDTALNIVHGYLSNTPNNSEDAPLFNRIMTNILQCVETCSYELKEKVLFPSLNQNMTKLNISNYLQGSGVMSCHTSKVFDRLKED